MSSTRKSVGNDRGDAPPLCAECFSEHNIPHLYPHISTLLTLVLPAPRLFVPLADIDRIALSEQASSPRALVFSIKESNNVYDLP